LHDDLDAAVAAAYGWPVDLTDAEILERVVALNAARAAEEARGKIRWLRPEFQAPAQGDFTLAGRSKQKVKKAHVAAPKKSRVKLAWPKDRPAQVKVVADALNAAGRALTAAELAAGFSRAQKETVAEILVGLLIIGRVHRGEKRGTYVAA
jgi:hypothetical protein